MARLDLNQHFVGTVSNLKTHLGVEIETDSGKVEAPSQPFAMGSRLKLLIVAKQSRFSVCRLLFEAGRSLFQSSQFCMSHNLRRNAAIENRIQAPNRPLGV